MEILSTPRQYLFNLETLSSSEAKRLWRSKIKQKWNYECAYCGSDKDLTIDHIVPKHKGGKDSWENLVAACVPCNAKKGNKLLKDMNMKLLKQPKAPSLLFNMQNDLSHAQNSWKPYLFMKEKY